HPLKDIDDHALQAPPEAEKLLSALAKYLAKPCKSEQEKARAIYRWITDRIAYDAEGFLSGKHPSSRPDVVLKDRKAVCEGYASLYVDLATRMGLTVEKVSGYAKTAARTPGATFAKERHAWNAVQIQGRWGLIDATWGAGFLNGAKFEK